MADPPSPHLGLVQLRQVMERSTAPLRQMAVEQERLKRLFQRAFDEALAPKMDLGVQQTLRAFEASFKLPTLLPRFDAQQESQARDVSRPPRSTASARPAASSVRSPTRPPAAVARLKNRKPHGKSPCERLRALWDTEEGALRILRANNAAEIAAMIGKGVTQTKASRFFKETIQPHRKWFRRELFNAQRSRLTDRGEL